MTAFKLPPLVVNYILLVVLASAFGSNFMMTNIAVQDVAPLTIVAARLVIAALVLFAVMMAGGYRLPLGMVWVPLALTGIFGHVLPYFLITWGQQVVDAGLSAIFMAIMPIFTVILAHFFTDDEKLNRYVVGGFVVAFSGVVVLFGLDKLLSLDGASARQYALLAAALCYGINVLLTKPLAGLPWQSMAAGQMLVAVALVIPVLLFIRPVMPDADVSIRAIAAIVYTGLVPTAFGAMMIFVLVRRAGAAFLSQINFLVPLVGVGLALLFLGETLPPNGLAALALILSGVALARARPKRKIISINRGV